jgi:hypothetical protein
MLPNQGSAQDVENARAAIFLIAVIASIFWREVLRLLLAIVAIAVCAGVFVLLRDMHV